MTVYFRYEAVAQVHRVGDRGLVLLIGLTGMAAYIFATSDFVRAQIENHANAVSGRKTKIARLSVDWGWTPHCTSR